MVEQNKLNLNNVNIPAPGSDDIDNVMHDFSKVKEYSEDTLSLLENVLDLYHKKVSLKKKLDILYKDYLKGFFNYITYTKSVMKLLNNKHERVYFNELNKEIISKLQDIKSRNSMIFQTVYEYEPSIKLRPQKIMNAKHPLTNISDINERKTFRVTPEIIEDIKRSKTKIKRQMNSDLDSLPEMPKGNWTATSDEFIGKKTEQLQKKSKHLQIQNTETKKVSDVVADAIKNTFKFEKEKESIFTEDIDLKKERAKKSSGLPLFKILKSFFVAEEKSFFDKSKDSVILGFKSVVNKLIGKQTPTHHKIISHDTVLSDRFKQLRKIRFDVKDEKSYDLGLLSEQLKADIFTTAPSKGVDAPTMDYNVSSYGALANILVKDASLELINAFPDFFKQLYHSLRLANIPILSNTYTNMMVLTTFIITALGFIGSFAISIAINPILTVAIANSVFFMIMFGAISFVGFLSYPHYKIKKREQDIRTNLPFSIDHMSAVISSGVAPAAMFKLIVASKEYGEISKEIEKIVEYIDLFGYDLLTSIETVAQLSPSDELKEFFEGFISTVESGGDLKNYLREKADASMIQYKLERQKYTDVISTFSDVYTGIMVASPLFFVATLSLIGILGGGVGGIDINLIVIFGTYIIIPLLNVLFMVFIELTQPNV